MFGLISAAAGFFNARAPLDNAILWERLHLRRWWKNYGELLTLIVLFLGAAAITVSQFYGDYLHKFDGTYSISDEGQTLAWIKISGHKWSDSSNQSGTLDRDGNNLVFYSVLFGSKTKIAEGTVDSGTLTLQTGNSNQITYEQNETKAVISTSTRVIWIIITLALFVGAVVCAFRRPKRFLEVNHQNNDLNDNFPKNEAKKDDPAKDDTDKPDLPQQ